MRDDWAECTLGKISQLNPKLENKHEIDSELDVQFLPMKLVEEASNTIHRSEVRKFSEVQKKSYTYFAEGDVLFAKVTPCMENGKIAVAKDLKNRIGFGSSEFHVFRPNDSVLSDYLFHFLVRKEFRHNAQHSMTGAVGLRRVPKNYLASHSIPLAPLPEQRAIVAKIEGLFSDFDQGIADLKTAQAQLKIYRKAVLKKAFEGELTKAWRKQQTDLPSAEELLEQIKEERQKFYDQQIEEWKAAVETWEQNDKDGKKPAKPRPLTIPDPPNAGHNDRKWKIPENWIWTQLGMLSFVTKLAGFEYTDYVKYDDEGDLPVLKAENAGPAGFKKTEFSKVRSETVQMLTRSQLLGGELLIVFVGAGTGNVAMVPFNQIYFLGPNVGMARPYFELDSRYIECFFQSAFGKSLMMSAVKAVAQPSLSMGTIRQAPIAFPSLEEQHQIVREIESRLSVCDEVEETIFQSLEKAEALR